MTTALSHLPDDLDTLKALVREQQAEIARLKEYLKLLLAKRYGPSSEQVPAEQLSLFNEAEQAAEISPAPEQRIQVPAHTRVKPGRRPLPEYLPRIEVVHALPQAERVCRHDGKALVEIGRETSEQLDVIPAQVRVIRHVRIKYACPCCHLGVTTAPMPAQPIPKSIASPGLLAHVAVAKYQDGLPLYRQEAILKRSGIELPRATLAGWMVRMGFLIQPLINLMREHLLDYDILQMDETRVQVLKEAGKAPTALSYMWVARGGPPEQPVVLFDYDPTRSATVPQRLLAGYTGYLQTDGYEGYNAVARDPAIVPVGCAAHARRKFEEATKAQSKQAPKTGKAWQGLAYFQKLYRIERHLKDQPPAVRYQGRQTQAKPLLEEMRTWLDTSLPKAPPQTATGRALTYLHGQWEKLIRYLDDGRLPIDNNLVENAIRPFALGRKAWLFADTVNGAKASANLYSLIETAKANGLEPYAYLRYVFTELPKAETVDAIEALLPYNVDKERLILARPP